MNDRLKRLQTELQIARHAAADTATLLQTKARPWFEAEGKPLTEEPAILLEAGQVAVDLAVAQASLSRATRSDGALAEARGLVGQAALRATSHLFAAAGTTAVDDPADYGRHWSAVRRSTVEDPIAEAFIAAGRAALTEAEAAPQTEAFARAHGLAADLRASAIDRDLTPELAAEGLARFARSGLLAANLPQERGGLGLSHGDTMEISRILCSGEGSIGQVSTIHYAMVEQLVRSGTPAQQDRWFAAVLNQGRFGNAAAERGVAHAKITETRLTPDGPGQFLLNGRKFYSTGAPGAVMNLILAQDPKGDLVSVLVPADAPGVTVLDDWVALGQRSTGSGSTILDNVLVPQEDILPRWINSTSPSAGTGAANLAHVAIDLGIARGGLLAALPHLQGTTDAVKLHLLGQLVAQLHAGEALFDVARARLAELPGALSLEDAQAFSLQVSVAKAHAADLAVEFGAALFDLIGPASLDPALGLDRHWRDARTHTLHDPTRWRHIHAGAHLLTGRLPPRNRCN